MNHTVPFGVAEDVDNFLRNPSSLFQNLLSIFIGRSNSDTKAMG
jgi:hypothetical protein